MVTLLIVLHPNVAPEKASEIKKAMVEYLGTRMCLNPDSTAPHILCVNDEIPFADQNILKSMAKDIEGSAIIVHINHDNDCNPLSSGYIFA